MSKFFIDTKFLEGTQKKWFGQTKPTIDLISIALVTERNSHYYAISNEFNIKEAWNRWQPRTGCGDRNNFEPREYWIRDNVLQPIFLELADKFIFEPDYRGSVDMKFTYDNLRYLISYYGKSNKLIAEEIVTFIQKHEILSFNVYTPDMFKPEFYGYYSDYDWVVFCLLFGKMINLPNGFPMYCHDLQQEIDRIEQLQKEKQIFFLPLKDYEKYPKQTNEHTALGDAKWNKQLYGFLNKIN